MKKIYFGLLIRKEFSSMAFDGIVIANIVSELKQKLIGGRILKISQPEKDELVLTIKNYDSYKLFISAGASLPLIYLTKQNRPNPITAPNFCMLLRKYLNSARIVQIIQPGLERVIQFEIEHLDELGDLCKKYLIVEIMGKHSNIIFCDDTFTIIDSIKHVSGFVSSVREVLPGRNWFIPKAEEKQNPLTVTYEDFYSLLRKQPVSLAKALYSSLTGLSPLISNELCYRASIDSQASAATFPESAIQHLYGCFSRLMEQVKEEKFTPAILYREKEPLEFSCVSLTSYQKDPKITTVSFSSISELLEQFYAAKDKITRIRQKSADLRRVVSTAMERDSKKYDLQLKQLKDTEKREKYKIYGELLTTYGYHAAPEAKELKAVNYYDGNEITIPLDPTLSAMENAKKYFEKYSKLKRTYEALSKLTLETKSELEHLDSIRTALEIAQKEEDLTQVKEELIQYGYMKRHQKNASPRLGKGKEKKPKITSQPLHYLSSDGYHIYVGKNNFQNDELTFHFSNGSDWWFHAKGIPGSHVIVKFEGKPLPDRVFEEAGALAAYYSKQRESEKVEIDYVERKNVKKPNGAKPGFVVYYTNYSLIVKPDISALTLLSD